MRPERQIKERIEIYKAQIEDYKYHIVSVDTYSEKEYYRNLIRKNMDAIELLEWAADKTVAESREAEEQSVQRTLEEAEAWDNIDFIRKFLGLPKASR